MKRIEITINGVSYPCSLTMGAMIRFKEITGHEVTDFDNSMKDMCAFIWCCIAAACKREGVKFSMDFMDFADSVEPQELTNAFTSVQTQAAETSDGEDAKDEKKSL